MSEHKIPRGSAAEPEAFQAHEAATGKTFPIREMGDSQLERHISDAKAQANAMKNQLLGLLASIDNIQCAIAVMSYELDRRRRTIAIVSDLTTIRRQ